MIHGDRMKTLAHEAAPPNANWSSYPLARYYFVPEYIGRGAEWQSMVFGNIEHVLKKNRIDWERLPRHVDDELVYVRMGDLAVEFGSDYGRCFVEVLGYSSFEFGWGELTTDRRELVGEVSDVLMATKSAEFTENYAAQQAHVIGLLTAIAEMFRPGLLDLALKDGPAVIMARVNSPTAPFVQLAYDQWRYFRFSDRDQDEAEGPNGERLFSIFVAPSSSGVVSATPIMSTIATETACQKWLVQQMAASPRTPTATKGQLFARARERWAGLSKRSFDRAWQNAISQTRAEGWVRAGRRSQTPQI